MDVSETDLKRDAQRLREWAICMLQHVLMSVSRSEGSGKVLVELNVIWFHSIPATAWPRSVEPPSAARDQTQSCNIWTAMEIKTEGQWGRGGGWAVLVGCWVMCEVKGHRCSKKQMLDVSRYTASPADRDIIFIQPEVPFMLIGATEWRRGEWRRRWGGMTAGGKKGVISACCLMAASRGKSRGRAKDKWRCFTHLTSPLFISLSLSCSLFLLTFTRMFQGVPSVKALPWNSDCWVTWPLHTC